MSYEYLLFVLIILFILRFLNKKLKKYIKIFKINGLDGTYYYFINKNIKKTGLNNFIDKKKKYPRKKNRKPIKK